MLQAIKTASRLMNPRLKATYAVPGCSVDAAAVIAAPFNRYLEGDRPDESNYLIADVAALYIRRCGSQVPFIGQFEHTGLLARWGLPVVQFESYDGEWVQTHRLIVWIAEEVRKLGRGNKVLLVGHPHHVRRVAILAMHYGLDPRVVPESESVPYDPRKRYGSQWWCRSKWRYIPWEYLLARPKLVMDALLGKL